MSESLPPLVMLAAGAGALLGAAIAGIWFEQIEALPGLFLGAGAGAVLGVVLGVLTLRG